MLKGPVEERFGVSSPLRRPASEAAEGLLYEVDGPRAFSARVEKRFGVSSFRYHSLSSLGCATP